MIGIEALKQYKQFIIWRLTSDGRKVPLDYRTNRAGNPTNPDTWLTYDQARAKSQKIGFVFTANDPFFFLDIDGCLVNGKWNEIAEKMLKTFAGCAAEVSYSNRGLHVFGTYTGVEPVHGCDNKPLGLELYTSGRFVALTESQIVGDAGYNCTAPLLNTIQEYFESHPTGQNLDWNEGPVKEWYGPKDNKKLIGKMLRSASAAALFGHNRATVRDLWECNEEVLAVAYPDPKGEKPFNASAADAALAQHLAFWTGKDCPRMLELMHVSGLSRDKWASREGYYLERTITVAVSQQKDVYNPQRSDVKSEDIKKPDAMGGPEVVSGFQFLGKDLQLELFANCVYVQDLHRILTAKGDLLNPERFNAMFGGYVFQLDDTGDSKTTKKAWEAFTESQIIRHPKADGICFKPDLKPNEVYNFEGRNLVNVYVPVKTERKLGDATPFIDHMGKLLPVKTDRDILLAYMAACVQHKGVKFQWAPLIQGVEGNGKTMLSRCLKYALGAKYTFVPNAKELDTRFNSWLMNKLLITIEDVYIPDNKLETIETLKPMITNGDGIEIQGKGVDQITADICCNFILNSNHKDAIRKTEKDRRFAVFYTAQQTPDDIRRQRMDGNYFPNLYKWLKCSGYAIVNELLHTYKIPAKLNPATVCHRAPQTSSTEEAIAASRGSIEQEILEAIDEGRIGFVGGWVSSMKLDDLLTDTRNSRRLPRQKRREVMSSLGYEYHPGLKGGRVNSHLMTDNGKPRLYVKNDSKLRELRGAKEIEQRYEAAQSGNIFNSKLSVVKTG